MVQITYKNVENSLLPICDFLSKSISTLNTLLYGSIYRIYSYSKPLRSSSCYKKITVLHLLIVYRGDIDCKKNVLNFCLQGIDPLILRNIVYLRGRFGVLKGVIGGRYRGVVDLRQKIFSRKGGLAVVYPGR